MQILNFTEPLIKPALQDRSKCYTIRKAWDWLDEGQKRESCWREQIECRHKVGVLETLMWNQRGKNGVYSNCMNWGTVSEKCLIGGSMCGTLEGDATGCFSKVFGVGRILQTKKIWLYNDNEHIAIKTKEHVLDLEECDLVSKQDGFKDYIQFCDFFINRYPIITETWMPFWRINWKWRVEL